MCNLYSVTTNQEAIRALFRVMNRYVGNLAPMPGVFPDYPAPVVRNAGAERELVLMRWGMPPPPRTGGPPVTNIRNTSSPHWRGWLKPENRCLVPFNSFAEYAPEPNPEAKKEGRRLVRDQRRSAADLLCRHLDRVQGRPRDEIETDPGPASGLRLSHDVAERGRRTDSSESHAGPEADHACPKEPPENINAVRL